MGVGMSYLTDYIPDRVRWAVCTGQWLFMGFVLIRLMFDLQPMPASGDLREVSGTVAGIDTEWQVRLMLYGLIAVYLPLTVAGGLYLRRKWLHSVTN